MSANQPQGDALANRKRIAKLIRQAPSAASVLPELSLVVPVFNEEANVPNFLERVIPILNEIGDNWEIVFVNDGSRDATLDLLRLAHTCDQRVRAIDFSRNFGKEIALCAGLDHTRGKAVIPIDVDLQDPPELIIEMVAKWRAGFDVVLAQRVDRSSDSWAKRTAAAAFYRVIAKLSKVAIPADVGDFRLLDSKVVEAVRGYRERARFMKGIFATLGYKTCFVSYTRAPRANGDSKFNPFQLMRLAIEGIVSFTDVPLKIWTYVGGLTSLAAAIYAIFILLNTVIFGNSVPGYASLVIFTLLLNGLTLLGLGIQGEYVARIFAEVKGRPLYLVRESIGLAASNSRFSSDRNDARSAEPIDLHQVGFR